MPTTYYYTVNGRIIGEKTTGGSRIDYLTDALGSVTATVNQSAQVVNTYRYKPYGGLLARTGAGSDPSFRWVGTVGYRETGKNSADKYVRARHASTTLGQWTSREPLPNQRYPFPYICARDNPTTRTDPSGLMDGIALGCGLAMWLVDCWQNCFQNPCAWAKDRRLLPPPPRGKRQGYVVCCLGSKFICVEPDPAPPTRIRDAIERCIKAHELSHRISPWARCPATGCGVLQALPGYLHFEECGAAGPALECMKLEIEKKCGKWMPGDKDYRDCVKASGLLQWLCAMCEEAAYHCARATVPIELDPELRKIIGRETFPSPTLSMIKATLKGFCKDMCGTKWS